MCKNHLESLKIYIYISSLAPPQQRAGFQESIFFLSFSFFLKARWWDTKRRWPKGGPFSVNVLPHPHLSQPHPQPPSPTYLVTSLPYPVSVDTVANGMSSEPTQWWHSPASAEEWWGGKSCELPLGDNPRRSAEPELRRPCCASLLPKTASRVTSTHHSGFCPLESSRLGFPLAICQPLRCLWRNRYYDFSSD